MATATKFTDTELDGDVIRRGIKRTLPCRLTEAEFMQIAKQRVDKEALLDQQQADFDKLKAKHKAQVDELDGEIAKMRQELHTGEQDRTVLCIEVFKRAEDGTGWVHTLRMDKLAAAYAAAIADGEAPADARSLAAADAEIERRPATPPEAQRYLPGVEGVPVDRAAPLLDQATAAQGAAKRDEPEDDEEEDNDTAEDDGLAELTPAQRAAKESAAARAARRGDGKKRGGRGKGKS